MVLVRLLLLLAAVALGLTPAAAHGGYGGAAAAVHCAGPEAAAAADGAHGDHGGQPSRTLAPMPALCLCAMVTTLAPGLSVPPPRILADVRPTVSVPTLEGRSPPPGDRPPRA
jgi:hypothetical protein